MASETTPRTRRILTRQAHPAPGLCLLAVDGVACPHPIRWRGVCKTHFQRLQRERRVEEFARPSKRKYSFALKPDPDPALCRLIVNDEPCVTPAQRRGLCSRHYQGLWQRPDLDIEDFGLPLLPDRLGLRKDSSAGACRVEEAGRGCREKVHARGLCARHYKVLASRPALMDRIALPKPREIHYGLRLRPRAGRCRVTEDGTGCSQLATVRGLCPHHYATLSGRPDLLERVALPSSLQPAKRFSKAPDAGEAPLTCVVLENGVRCSAPPEIRGVCRRHHRILGSHADHSLHDFYLPQRETVLTRKLDEETRDGLCLAVEDGRPCAKPPHSRGLCRAHYRLATQRGVLDALAAPFRPRGHLYGGGNDRPHYYLDKNVLYDHADHRVFGTSGQDASVTLVEAVRNGRVRACVSLDAVKSTYSHVRYRLQRPPEEGGRGLSEQESDSLARAYAKEVFYGGGAWRFVHLDALGFGRLVVSSAGALSLEDAMEFQTYQQERTGRAGPTMFVTRDTDFPEGVHPAHVVRALGGRV